MINQDSKCPFPRSSPVLPQTKDLQEIFDSVVLGERPRALENLKNQIIPHSSHPMKIHCKIPEDGIQRPLYIGLHGGGGCPPEVNDSQWEIHKTIYDMGDDVIWVVPRAPTNNWNLWHEQHMDDLYDLLIAQFNILGLIDPSRVYISGYSAGGDGIYKIAPRLADRFGAAVMCAGHPNGASVLNLKYLPFALQIGEDDGAYNRNGIGKEYSEKLKTLQNENPGHYIHKADIHKTGHWMKLLDKPAILWSLQFKRDPYPEEIIWHQCGDRVQKYFYYLKNEDPKEHTTVRVSKSGNTFSVISEDVKSISIRLNERFIDFLSPVIVYANGEKVVDTLPQIDIEFARQTVRERFDPDYVFQAELTIILC